MKELRDRAKKIFTSKIAKAFLLSDNLAIIESMSSSIIALILHVILVS